VRSKVDVGNRLQDRVFTEREVVSVENMTFRVWVMHLRSVVFGHESQGSVTPRSITGMTSLSKNALYIKDLVRQFAASQSIIVTPSSGEDARRMAAMGVLNDLGAAGAPSGVLAEAILSSAAHMAHQQTRSDEGQQPKTVLPADVQRLVHACPSCGARNDASHAFCDSCGSAMR